MQQNTGFGLQGCFLFITARSVPTGHSYQSVLPWARAPPPQQSRSRSQHWQQILITGIYVFELMKTVTRLYLENVILVYTRSILGILVSCQWYTVTGNLKVTQSLVSWYTWYHDIPLVPGVVYTVTMKTFLWILDGVHCLTCRTRESRLPVTQLAAVSISRRLESNSARSEPQRLSATVTSGLVTVQCHGATVTRAAY